MRLHHLQLCVIVLPFTFVFLVGCQGPQQKLDDATRAYDASDWVKAYGDASAAQSEAQPPLKQHAAFVAGLAAYRQDQFDEARTRFLFAETSDDKQISGQAKVMLGDLLVKNGQPAAAAAKYDQAASLLSGDAAQRASRLAESAREQSKAPPATPAPIIEQANDDSQDSDPESMPRAAPHNKKASAAKSDRVAKQGSNSSDKAASSRSSDKVTSTKANIAKTKTAKRFTIQCGAYVHESAARRRAKDLTDEAKRAGLAAPKVHRETGRDGKHLWVVSIGSFTSRDAGKKAMAKLKVDHAEVLPVTG